MERVFLCCVHWTETVGCLGEPRLVWKMKICIDITIHMGFNEICFQALEFEFSGILQNLSHSTTDFGYVETQRNEMFIFPILR